MTALTLWEILAIATVVGLLVVVAVIVGLALGSPRGPVLFTLDRFCSLPLWLPCGRSSHAARLGGMDADYNFCDGADGPGLYLGKGDAMRRALVSLAAAAMLSLPAATAPVAALAATQDGLVNVYVNDVEIAKDVNVGVVAQVVASVCANVNADVNALARQVDLADTPQTIECPATGDEIRLEQN